MSRLKEIDQRAVYRFKDLDAFINDQIVVELAYEDYEWLILKVDLTLTFLEKYKELKKQAEEEDLDVVRYGFEALDDFDLQMRDV